MKKAPYILFLLCLAMLGCEKKISFKLDDVSQKLVVEATIENGQPPVVLLSNSLGFFSQIDQATLSNNFVHNADVYVSNGTLTHKLKEYTVPVGGGYNFYYYSIDSSSLVTAFVGALNKQYSLRVITGGAEYDAITTIPNFTKHIDSLFWKPAPPGNPAGKAIVMLKATDPPGYGDYSRYFTKRNSEPFYPGLNSVYDDQVIDGTTYEVEVSRGLDRNAPHYDDSNFFDLGDTVTLKLSSIDKATYDFWRTMEFTYTSLGDPFSSPTKVIGNISNGALGYFGGYASQFKTVIIPH